MLFFKWMSTVYLKIQYSFFFLHLKLPLKPFKATVKEKGAKEKFFEESFKRLFRETCFDNK